MFFFNKTKINWGYFLPSNLGKPILFPSIFSLQLEEKYLSLFDEENPSSLNLMKMRMYERNSSTNYKIQRLGLETTQMLGISLVICRNKAGKFLAVNEKNARGWYLPAGRVDPPENFYEAAIREAKEEASIDIEIKGILKHEYNIIDGGTFMRYRVIFYAEPKDDNQKVKTIPDKESLEARWVSMEELKKLGENPPFLRGTDLLHWGKYIENGGNIYPISSFQENPDLF